MKSVSYVGFFHKNQNDYRFKNSKTKLKVKKKKNEEGVLGLLILSMFLLRLFVVFYTMVVFYCLFSVRHEF